MARLTNEDHAAIREANSITFKQDGDAAQIVCDGLTVPAPFRRALEFNGERADGARRIRVRSNTTTVQLTMTKRAGDPALRTVAAALRPGDDLMLLWTATGSVTTLQLVVSRWPEEPEPQVFVIGLVVAAAEDRPAEAPPPEPAVAAVPAPAAVPRPKPDAAAPALGTLPHRRLAKAAAMVAGAVVAQLVGGHMAVGALVGVLLLLLAERSPGVHAWAGAARRTVAALSPAKAQATAEPERAPLRTAA